MDTKHRFIQLHMLVAYPPSNPNRDELGEPKNAIMGGTRRSRTSSQSLKYAWRTSELWKTEGLGIGERTRELFIQKEPSERETLFERLLTKGDAEKAENIAKEILNRFAKTAKVTQKQEAKIDEKYVGKEIVTEQPIHYSTSEITKIKALIEQLVKSAKLKEPSDQELDNLVDKSIQDVDMAMFGRMVAKRPDANIEAAVQVAHAISINEVEIEQDYFTAVDDLNRHGAAHVGEQEFVSAVYYLYLCIDTRKLTENIGDIVKARKAVQVLAESAATIPPGGKLNSYANYCQAFYILAEKGNAQPRNLSLAFLKHQRADEVEKAIKELIKIKSNFNRAYTKPDAEKEMNLFQENGGSLKDIQKFVGDF